MSTENILTQKAGLIAAIRDALNGKGKASAASSEAGESVSAAIRAYANATHADGDDPKESREALAAMLTVGGIKPGTVKGSGNHFAGFRAMLAADLNIDTGKEGKPYTNADAQAFIESDTVKRVKAVKALISEAVKEAGKKAEGEATDTARVARLETIAETLGCDMAAYRAEYANNIGADADDDTNEGQPQEATG